jgi:sugar transferase (PEP-CTERM/EpsH1 system associated)
MKSLLFLCHRLPWPPDKGDKIRSFHVLEALRRRYRVFLGTFVDDREDWAHVDTVRQRTAGLCVRPLPRRRATVRSLRGLFTGEALTLPFYRDAGLASWVREVLRTERPAVALVYSSGMAQYVQDESLPVRVMDFCDIDSDKWAQYARSKTWPASAVYAREARRLACAERSIAERFDASLFVSAQESGMFAGRHPDLAARIVTVGNGVDTAYFDPAAPEARPGNAGAEVVFTGAMDYWANVDAVKWFAEACWPAVRAIHPRARFAIVGSRPAPEVRRLAELPGIEVTGRVPDVRPWLAGARAVIAPLRIARGVQNKVLEAMAMARPVVATGAALQGLGQVDSPAVQCADEAAPFAAAVAQLLHAPVDGSANRSFVLESFSWEASLQPLWPLLEPAA